MSAYATIRQNDFLVLLRSIQGSSKISVDTNDLALNSIELCLPPQWQQVPSPLLSFVKVCRCQSSLKSILLLSMALFSDPSPFIIVSPYRIDLVRSSSAIEDSPCMQ
jgi:hypothetical protein